MQSTSENVPALSFVFFKMEIAKTYFANAVNWPNALAFQKALFAPSAFQNRDPVFRGNFLDLVMVETGFFHFGDKLRQL